jgi:hypothetical protein
MFLTNVLRDGVRHSWTSADYRDKHIRYSYLVQSKGKGKGKGQVICHPTTCLCRLRREAEV